MEQLNSLYALHKFSYVQGLNKIPPKAANMFQRYSIIIIIPLLAIISCTPAIKPPINKIEKDMRFNNLLDLNDRSERAFMYHHYCLSDEPINEKFMQNFKMVSNLLLDETVEKINMPPQMVVQRILGRRKTIQQQLSQHYNSAGCQSEEGKAALVHYRAFSSFDKRQINTLVVE